MSNLFLALLLISFVLLSLGFISPKASLFWYKKERTRKKSFLIYLLSIILFFILFGVTIDKDEYEKSMAKSNDPLSIGKDSVQSLIGKKVPYNNWGKWGVPKTLEGTDNQYWVVYLDSANVSFISEKMSDKIIFADFNEDSALKYISYLEDKRQKRDEKINKLLYTNGANSVNIKLKYLVKKDLNDPNSMDNIEVSYLDKDSIIIVNQRFTAKNKFGGTLRKEVVVAIDTLGNITNVIKWID